MKRCRFFLFLFIVTIVTGCVKDNNPYPYIRYTTWKSTSGNTWQRVSFSSGRVHHQFCHMMDSDTIEYYDYYADYAKENEDGRHFFSWVFQKTSTKYRVFSFGVGGVVIDAIPYGEGPWIGGFFDGLLFYRDEDPVDGYNF